MPSTPAKGITPTKLFSSPSSSSSTSSSSSSPSRFTSLTPTRLSLSPNTKIRYYDRRRGNDGSGRRMSKEREQFWLYVQFTTFILLAAGMVFAISQERARINAELDLEILLFSVKSSLFLRASSSAGGDGTGGGDSTSPLGRGGSIISPQERSNNDDRFLKLDFDSAIREGRFPSVEERVRLYMSDWYVVPCHDHAAGSDSPMVRYHFLDHGINDENDDDGGSARVTSLIVNGVDASGNPTRLQIYSIIESDRLFFLDPSRLPTCYDDPDSAARVYCRDVSDTIVPLLTQSPSHENNNNNSATPPPPLLLQFGDNLGSRHYGHVQVPHIRKFRLAMNRTVLADITAATCHDRASSRARPSAVSAIMGRDDDTTHFQGILWKLNTKRHFGDIVKVERSDVPWSEKKNKAIFWGGPNQRGQEDIDNANADGGNEKTSSTARAALTDSEKCHAMPRCHFVLMYANSTLVEAKLSKTRDIFASNVIDGIEVTTPQGRKSVTEVIKYKGIIMLEGNDVASGLKWSLYSNSVVLMPPPTFTSFAMEELLVPYVHYVPLRPDLSDAQEQMQWILDNDVHAQKIAQTGKQWIHDLLFHEDAARDNELVNREILKRYRMHFEEDTSVTRSIQ